MLATLAALVVALIAWRPLLLAHPVDLFTHGVSGGELAGLHSDAGTVLQWMRQAFDPSGLGRPGRRRRGRRSWPPAPGWWGCCRARRAARPAASPSA
ncbi:hypothetical protein [Arsenicicoccus piscis]|uniref:Uncharacterized protein n=1 Tax=Arsenicicoccus piscis TaxID=673954 RepID=A0ABQ6HJ35_9MICO|nr:hypothetical protein [Arsenicicoccus piscis]GMA18531.1 hypothetical protein GCM10025862_05520 [Arsenicicoccus piscis]